jgi:hypothetical protein
MAITYVMLHACDFLSLPGKPVFHFLVFLISFAPISNLGQTRGARRVC